MLANPRFEQMVDRTGLVGQRGREAIPDVAARPTWDILDELHRTGEPFLGNEYPSLWGLSGAGSSEERFFNFVVQPKRKASGEIDSMMIHAVEITDSVAARRRS
jgi:hypothetical protein